MKECRVSYLYTTPLLETKALGQLGILHALLAHSGGGGGKVGSIKDTGRGNHNHCDPINENNNNHPTQWLGRDTTIDSIHPLFMVYI